MRSLNRSLPSSTTAARPAPPEQLLQAFKQAALSVTNLYKSAAIDHESIRQAGYQDALDDLLKFLDRENLGLQDGEGWRVRQWATGRYDGSANTQQSESEDEQADSDQRQRSVTPERNIEEDDTTPQQPRQEQLPAPSIRVQSEPPDQPSSRSMFQFSAGPDSAMSTDELLPSSQPSSSAESRSNPVKVEVTRNRNAHKNNSRHNPKPTSRAALQPIGSKRKLPFPDISDIFNVGFDKKDGFEGGNGNGAGGGGGGSKRSRLV